MIGWVVRLLNRRLQTPVPPHYTSEGRAVGTCNGAVVDVIAWLDEHLGEPPRPKGRHRL